MTSNSTSRIFLSKCSGRSTTRDFEIFLLLLPSIIHFLGFLLKLFSPLKCGCPTFIPLFWWPTKEFLDIGFCSFVHFSHLSSTILYTWSRQCHVLALNRTTYWISSSRIIELIIWFRRVISLIQWFANLFDLLSPFKK